MRRLATYAALLPLLFSSLAFAGATEQAIDAQINARVYTVLDSLDLLPTVEDPPVEPPPPPPPPPPPGSCLDGFDALGGFWTGWCGDEYGNFLTDPAEGFGIMRSNAQAFRSVAADTDERWVAGYVSFDLYMATDAVPGTGGGKHLGGPTSYAQPYDSRPPSGSPRGWLRPDITIRTDFWRVHMYNTDIDGLHPGVSDVVSDAWNTGIPVGATKRWIPMRMEWRRRSATEFWIKFTVSSTSKEHTYRVQASSLNIGRVVFGNVDGLSTFGGTPRIYFRNVKWGKL